ncbi:MAG: helix-turn-helix domain-containing protein [Clostridia bacterium]|nr:helix-turn-helix domain-containing protein [Clostridia bacterium]
MITLSEIQKRLIESIKQSGISQTDLAKKIGVCQQAISSYIKGQKMPALDTLANLCKVIDISPAYILCFEDESGSKLTSEVFEYSDGKHSIRHKFN